VLIAGPNPKRLFIGRCPGSLRPGRTGSRRPNLRLGLAEVDRTPWLCRTAALGRPPLR